MKKLIIALVFIVYLPQWQVTCSWNRTYGLEWNYWLFQVEQCDYLSINLNPPQEELTW